MSGASQKQTIKSFALFLLLLLTISLRRTNATYPKVNAEVERPHEYTKDEETTDASSSEPKPSIFPKQLDISSLKNMPLVILHPRTPINLQMLPGENIASLHKSLNPNKILELLQSATFSLPAKTPPPNGHETRQARDRKFANYKPQASVNRPQSTYTDFQQDTPALPRSLLNHPSSNGWFQRFRGSFSNMFPSIRPMKENAFQFGLPTVNMPMFMPHQNHMQTSVNPFMLGSQQQFQIHPWRNFHMPSMMHHGGDLTADASFMHPTRMVFGNTHMNPYRPAPMTHPQFGGDLAMSGSSFMPHRVLPMGNHHFSRFVSPVQRHKPLFNNIDGLHAASMEISNAFADFTDSKEHGPEVTQKFGAVGHSINSFLKMMGLGATDSFDFNGATGFGGGSHMAGMDSTPIARSMDFYPGYGNQAHLDDMDDFPIFHEDITEGFMKKVNLTSEKKKEAEKQVNKKETTTLLKTKLEATEKIKGSKDSKPMNTKAILPEEKNMPYVPAVPLDKINIGENASAKSELKPVEQQGLRTERPLVNYNVPPTHATVAPGDRKQPIAIYQHFSSAKKENPKPPHYAPAQTLPQQESETNPNRLVDEDEVRQWRLVNSGQGYVEKRPVPIVDILQAVTPESLKVLQKVLSGDVRAAVTS